MFFWYSDDNIVTRNFFKFNDLGLCLYEYSDRNTIYLNCFSNNSLTAYDEEGTSHWDNGTLGNYWSDYTGVDSDENGIGDTPYNITLSSYNSGTNQDNFPLIECPLPVPVQDVNGDAIPLELIIIISSISGGAVIGVATLLLIIRKRKRIYEHFP
jgi:parallel beta-helix repeat protein